jgi:glutaredoxin
MTPSSEAKSVQRQLTATADGSVSTRHARTRVSCPRARRRTTEVACALPSALAFVCAAACSGTEGGAHSGDDDSAWAERAASGGPTSAGLGTSEGEPATPPFPVRGDLAGLLIVWYDAEGMHPARTRADVPEPHRGEVRVDSLSLPPEQRLDPAFVYVADVRTPRADGSYPVRKVPREVFEARVAAVSTRATALAGAGGTDPPHSASASASGPGVGGAPGTSAGPQAPGGSATAAADVVVYGASWCGACRQAKQFLASRGVPFIERDVEREPGAHAEMMRKARAQGLSPTGIPVIDVRGRILLGFDPGALARALAQTAPDGPGNDQTTAGQPI